MRQIPAFQVQVIPEVAMGGVAARLRLDLIDAVVRVCGSETAA